MHPRKRPPILSEPLAGIAAGVLLVLALTPAGAVVHCQYVGDPQGCAARAATAQPDIAAEWERYGALPAPSAMPATATADDFDLCADQSGDAAIAACSRAIASDGYRGADLAVLYNNRGSEYVNRRANLTRDRRPILTRLSCASGR